ncbi:uncharacterized small protein (DUF1192 family) [Rhizobium sp. SG_E_25_P2]|uniref:DUF1192 domain-containing protein n=1 Tax=Rhizobium sp. SG_E_25_P2 TaxID=2879942 RepID=UPI0024768E6B|nr:DUF1192 domain-containing protein [Rhizobium sp. SG_E_25_P2]MDH6269500.1 uncharacterized small protein (DUF1192 family) [Rhizobium sp. SG_E_25_P2]
MSINDDDKPARKLAHEIGMDISMLSADELKARIALLEGEISRLNREITAKTSSRSAAESLFKN